MRVIVTGGRDYGRTEVERMLVMAALMRLPEDAVLVHGAATGLDSIAHVLWKSWGREVERHPADWKRYGRGAGPKRNQEMADAGAELCLAFPGGNGTNDMIRRAVEAGIPVQPAVATQNGRP